MKLRSSSHKNNKLCRLFTVSAFSLAATLAGFAPSALAKMPSKPVSAMDVPEKWPEYPKVDYGTGPEADKVKRGEYLVKAGDCIACHTEKPNGVPFAGGLPLVTPFGTIYSPNLTPDKETGIGSWTDAQFVRAVREGISPTGSYYYPVFPYTSYNKLSESDVLAIRAYLAKIPAVHKENIPPDMPIPFRWRPLQLFWRLMFFQFEKGELKPDPTKTAEWNRGAYLVQALGHCGMCHTPINFLGAPKKEYTLTGGFASGAYAPNISESGIGKVPDETVLNVFLKDEYIGGGKIQMPMLEVNHDSLIYLDKADLQAMVVYLKSVKSKTMPQPKSNLKAVDLKVGGKIYNQYCASCHESGAGGAPKFGDQTAWAPRIKQGINVLYIHANKGVRGMPPKGMCSSCTELEVNSAVQYIVDHSQPGGAKVPVVSAVTESPTSLEHGKQIYNKVCSICHNQGQLGAPKLGDQAAWEPRIKQNMDVLIIHSINGYKGHPPMGSCYECSDADVIAAVKYMVQQSKTRGDYKLW